MRNIALGEVNLAHETCVRPFPIAGATKAMVRHPNLNANTGELHLSPSEF